MRAPGESDEDLRKRHVKLVLSSSFHSCHCSQWCGDSTWNTHQETQVPPRDPQELGDESDLDAKILHYSQLDHR